MKNLNTALPYDLNIDSISLLENKKTKNPLVFFQKKEVKLFLLLIVSVFICEIIAMLVFKSFSALSSRGEVVLHSLLLPVLMFPVIYIYLVKPLKVSIADRNAKEVRYTSLIENMGDGVIIYDAAEKFIFANVAAEKF
jgi:PAS domain-containing protein